MNMHVTSPKMSAQEKKAHIAVFALLICITGFLGYVWWSKPLQIAAPKPVALTPIQEASSVIRQTTSCLIDPKVQVGKPFKHISDVDTQTEQGGYFYASLTDVRFFNAHSEYRDRVIHCQKSVK